MRYDEALIVRETIEELSEYDTSIILLDKKNEHILTVVIKPNGEVSRFNAAGTTLVINGKTVPNWEVGMEDIH